MVRSWIISATVASTALVSPGSAATLRGAFHSTPQNRSTESTEDSAFDAFITEWFEDFLARRPLDALALGHRPKGCGQLKTGDAWGRASPEAHKLFLKQDQGWLAEMEQRFSASVGSRSMADERKVSFMVLQNRVSEMQDALLHGDFAAPSGDLFGCRLGVGGCQAQVASLLQSFKVESEEDGECFVQLLDDLPNYMNDHIERLNSTRSRKAVLFRQVLDHVRSDCEKVLPEAGKEQDPQQSHVYRNLVSKLQGPDANISATRQALLLKDAEHGILHGLWPAFRALREFIDSIAHEAPAGDRGLVSAYGSEGLKAYSAMLHSLNLISNVSSVHKRSLRLVQQGREDIEHFAKAAFAPGRPPASFSETLGELRTKFFQDRFPDTLDGSVAFLATMGEYLADTKARLSAKRNGQAEFFPEDVPKLSAFRPPSLAAAVVGGLPAAALPTTPDAAHGVAYAADATSLPKAEMQALAFREAVPGRQMLAARTDMLLPTLPALRVLLGEEAFAEGWAAYAGDDIALNLPGNLSMGTQLAVLHFRQLRAVRAVVDTGLHGLGWNSEMARHFYQQNSLASDSDAKTLVEEHLARPGQALKELAGYQCIRSARDELEHSLQQHFDKDWDASLNSAFLHHGRLPLPLVGDVVRADLEGRVHGKH